MTKEHQIRFFKRAPPDLCDKIRTTLQEVTFMSVTFDLLNAVVGEHLQLQGAGVILVWFWDHRLAARKVISIDFSNPLIAKTEAEEWLDISIKESDNLSLQPQSVSLSINSSGPKSLQLDSLRFFSRVSHEFLTEEQEFNSYKYFLHEKELQIKSLAVEHDFVNWIVLGLKGGQTIIIERGDQVATFYLYFDDKSKINQIIEEVKNPDWGSIEVIEALR